MQIGRVHAYLWIIIMICAHWWHELKKKWTKIWIFSWALLQKRVILFLFIWLCCDDIHLVLTVIRFIIFNTNTSQNQFMNKGKYSEETAFWKLKVTFPENTNQKFRVFRELTVKWKIELIQAYFSLTQTCGWAGLHQTAAGMYKMYALPLGSFPHEKTSMWRKIFR